MFNNSFDSITKPLAKVSAKLEAFADSEAKKAEAKRLKAEKLISEKTAHETEIVRSRQVAKNINKFLEVK